ncbi:MAG: serine/threonine protein phosphatase, partial [Clostridia bacterium]|nr:serine/threonine protein phosphatase [Clostridia bacterium]
HRIAAGVTKGRIPVVFARGNHDTRGKYAERLANHTPTDNGRSYYSVRLGKLWMLVLDCGEDKNDDHAEYGHTMCCHAFR